MNMTLANIGLIFVDILLLIYVLRAVPIVIGDLLEFRRACRRKEVVYEEETTD